MREKLGISAIINDSDRKEFELMYQAMDADDNREKTGFIFTAIRLGFHHLKHGSFSAQERSPSKSSSRSWSKKRPRPPSCRLDIRFMTRLPATAVASLTHCRTIPPMVPRKCFLAHLFSRAYPVHTHSCLIRCRANARRRLGLESYRTWCVHHGEEPVVS